VLTFYQIYTKLTRCYGEQSWWPADSSFEVMVGAILTQNTSWTNVERALDNLKENEVLNCTAIINLTQNKLATLLKPSGYFNLKAKRLKNLCHWYAKKANIDACTTDELRRDLLSINGVGPETADDILLYAFLRPIFVIDAYTRRVFSRLGLPNTDRPYDELRLLFEKKLSRHKNKVTLYNNYHALIVLHAKDVCRARKPLCEQCCLHTQCEYNDVNARITR